MFIKYKFDILIEINMTLSYIKDRLSELLCSDNTSAIKVVKKCTTYWSLNIEIKRKMSICNPLTMVSLLL